MDAQRWLRELQCELERRKLPRRYIRRFVLELSDHLTDFMEDHMSMDAIDLPDAVRPMGLPSQVATAAATEYRQQRFCGRHPWITFVALPVVTLPVLWAAIVLGIVGAGNVIRSLAGSPSEPTTSLAQLPDWLLASLPVIVGMVVMAPIVAAAVFYCRLANRAAMGWKWPMLACFLLALIAETAVADLSLPAAGSEGRLMFGLGVNLDPSMSQIVQFMVPVAIGAWAVWRQTQSRRQQYAT